MKQAFLFLVKFIAVTAPLTWLWQSWGRAAYRSIHAPAAHAVFDLLAIEHVRTPGRQRFIDLIPFVGLLLLTPRMSLRRRLLGLLSGLLALFILHIFSQLWADPKTRLLPLWAKTILDAAPFALWVVIAHEYVRELLQNTIGKHLDLTPTKAKDPALEDPAGRGDSLTP